MKDNPKVLEDFFISLRRKRILKVLLRWVRWLFIALCFVLLALYFLVQYGQFQTWLAKKVTTRLSADLNAEVSIGTLDVEFFNKIILEDFYIEDQKGDTLLFSKTLKADLSANLLDILNNKYDVDDIYLKDAQFNIKKEPHQTTNNLQFIIDELTKSDEEDEEKTKNPFYLDVDGLHLENVTFHKDDNVQGGLMTIYIPKGEITFNKIDIQNLDFGLDDVIITKPVVDIIDRERFLPEDLEDEEKPIEEIEADSAAVFQITVDNCNLTDGTFTLQNLRKAPVKVNPDDRIDWNHLGLFEINIDIENYKFTEGVSTGKVNGISLQESSGFIIEKLSSEQTKVSDRRIELYGMQLKTPYSDLGDTLVFKYREYPDFKAFNSKILMDIRFKDSKVAIKDIIMFAPKLENNAFFGKNIEEVISIDGDVKGRINNLRGKDLNIKLGNNVNFVGNFSSRNLAVKNEELLNLEVDRLQTDMATLRLLVPNFDPPNNFDKLNNIDFNGRFDGFFIDFVAYGNLRTDLGEAEMDMRMDLRQGRESARYSGGLSLRDFDLRRWSGNKDFGKVTFSSKVEDGFGLTLEKVNANVSAEMKEFNFRGYTYQNVTLDGTLNKSLFDGKLAVKDDNIDFTFNGDIEIIDSIPKFDFKANINHLDLKALNLIKDDFVFSGEIDLELLDIDLSKIQGKAVGYNIKAVKNGKEIYQIDSLKLNSSIVGNNQRSFNINSDVLDLDLNGAFDIQLVPEAFLQLLERNYPEFSNRFNLRSKKKVLRDYAFNYDLKIPDSKNLTYLIDPKLDTIRAFHMGGYFNNVIDSFSLDLELPEIAFSNLTFRDILVQLETSQSDSEINLEIYNTQTGGLNIEPVSLFGTLNRDTFDFEVNATNWNSLLDNLNLEGRFFLVEDDKYEVQFLPSDLEILKEKWTIDEDNFIRFGKDYTRTRNLDLTNGDFRIALEAVNNKGLNVLLQNFNLSIIDDYWDDERMDFTGKFDVKASVADFYTLKDFDLAIIADTLEINGDDWGLLRVDGHTPDLNSAVETYISITKGPEQLIVEGDVYLPSMDIAKERDFDVNIDISYYPLYIVEYFLGHAISNTVGRIDGAVTMGGRFKAPDINGKLRVYDGAVKVDYLQTTYYINDVELDVDPFLFDATGGIIEDSLGNQATIYGGITHDHVKAWGLDARIVTDEFLVLNTRKVHNPVYYGYALGQGDIRFNGPFAQIDISIDATPSKDTRIIIPITGDQDASEVSFITFINKNEQDSLGFGNSGAEDLRGISLGMNLNMTEDAEVLLVFDEKAGDIIQGRGSGDLQIFLSRGGDMTMFGDYEISEGNYLFTFYSLLNKPFTIVPGGTIKWDGDPFNANLDIVADYKGIRTPLTNFVSDYLTSDQTKIDARQTTSVDLNMLITGELVKPNIDFGISFPNLVGALKSFTDSRLRNIKQDQGELNRQVFGLIIIGGFLPSGTTGLIGVNDAVSGIQNTLSEVITSQLSLITTELLSEFVTGVDFISGVDFIVDYNVYDATEINGPVVLQGTEVGVRPGLDLLDDRLSVEVGLSYSQANSNAFFGTDFVVEWALNQNRRLKLRAYRRSDNTISGARNRTGAGISYRRGFNSFSELFERKAKRMERQTKEKEELIFK